MNSPDHPLDRLMRALPRHLPDGVGHSVFLLDWNGPGQPGYFSTAGRPVMITIIRDLLRELEALPASADTGPLKPHDDTFESKAFRLAMQTPTAPGGLAWISSTRDMGRIVQGIRNWLARQRIALLVKRD